jgi:branched-chain amino acid transport system ATP-binding protein
MSAMLLSARGVEAGYGAAKVLFGVSLEIAEGEVVTLIGRNGMGKTTTVRTLVGLTRATAGEIEFCGERIEALPPHRVARLGLGLVPEGRQIFPNLTVRENLLMAAIDRGHGGGAAWSLERVLDFFPRLGERLGNGGAQLSGGEQQMLAIGRALMTNPRLLVLDEATEGLAPVIRDEIWNRLGALKRTGLSILVIDKELEALCELADRHYVIEKGEIVWRGATSELMANPAVHATYLGV